MLFGLLLPNRTATGNICRLGPVSLPCRVSAAAFEAVPLNDARRPQRNYYAFIDHGVKYLIVGGYAFGVHAEPRRNQCFAYHILFGQKRGFCAVLKDVLRQMKL